METNIIVTCFHCGDTCLNDDLKLNDKNFCCNGCLTVYEILNQNGLDGFYNYEMDSRKRGGVNKDKYEFLDNSEIEDKILSFQIENKSQLIIELPDIHCSACLYLLENIYKINPAILESKVNFLKKEATILFDNQNLSLRKLSELLDSIGYPPNYNLASIENSKKKSNRTLYFQLAAAGFAFGNVMLFAFPDYLSGNTLDSNIREFLSYISLILSPIVLYAGSDFFKSAWQGLKVKHINVDLPLSLGIIALFLRSAFEILTGIGMGYIDSLTGLIFFLLLGKVFQKKTYDRLNFENDFSSYFPLSVQVKNKDRKYIALTELKAGDRIILKNGDIIPNNSILYSSKAFIDYSYVSGESNLIDIEKGGKLYAGGRIVGAMIEIDLLQDFDKEHLDRIWLGEKKYDKNNVFSHLSDNAAKRFTFLIIFLSIGSFIYWYNIDIHTAWDALTAVLIIACPCALALTTPFTYGTAIRILASKGFFIKEANAVETISRTKQIVFDKTGTLTDTKHSKIEYFGDEISNENLSIIRAGVENSNHPLSKILFDFLKIEKAEIDSFEEITGKGIIVKSGTNTIKIGSKGWLNFNEVKDVNESSVFIEINDVFVGYFTFKQNYRNNIFEMISKLKTYAKIFMISGDNDFEKEFLINNLGKEIELKFNMLPDDKYKYINELKLSGFTTLMIGDGLNDSGALNNADVGISVSNDASSFTPGSDAIIDGDKLSKLDSYLNFIKSTRKVVIFSFIISFLYNIVGLSFAITGNLSPLVAAILMPLSSISIVLFTTISTIIISKLKISL